MAHSHQKLSGVGYGRCSGVRYESYVHAAFKLVYQSPALFQTIILMIARHGSIYIEGIEQPYAVACILSGDQVNVS